MIDDPRRAARQYLGAELRRLREMAGVSGRQLAIQMTVPQKRLSRIERGEAVPSMPEVMRWADEVNADDQARDTLRRLTVAAFTDVTSHRDTLGVHGHLQGAVGTDEAGAGLIRNYSAEVVPGLLQTAEYARRVFSLADPHGEMDHVAALAGRMRRQELLYDQSRRFEFMLQESALRWRPGPVALLVAQLDRIASMSTLENVAVGIIPWTTEAPAPPYGAYAVHTDRNDELDPSVSVELVHGSAVISDPEDVARYTEHWTIWATVARWDHDARTYLSQLAAELHQDPRNG